MVDFEQAVIAHHQHTHTYPFPVTPASYYKLKLHVEYDFFSFNSKYKPLLEQPKPQGVRERGERQGLSHQFKISKPYHYCEKPRAYHKIITLPQPSQGLVYRILSGERSREEDTKEKSNIPDIQGMTGTLC